MIFLLGSEMNFDLKIIKGKLVHGEHINSTYWEITKMEWNDKSYPQVTANEDSSF